MIAVRAVTKRYGGSTAVEDLSFEVRPGVVTGLLGPNGSGKSTTLRIVLGLDHPTSGVATVDGGRYADLPRTGAPGRRAAGRRRGRGWPPGAGPPALGGARRTPAAPAGG